MLNKKEHHVARVRPPKEHRLAALGLEALGPNEVSARFRTRLDKKVTAVLERLTPKQRGEALLKGLEVLGLLEGVQDEQETRQGCGYDLLP